jgi:plastocyanin
MKQSLTLVLVALIGSIALPAAAPTTNHTVQLKDFAFKPATLTIAAGERVTFQNDDDEAHTVTATDKSFDSAGLDSGQSWSHTFSKAGTYAYFCALHPYMKGKIIVRPSTSSG